MTTKQTAWRILASVLVLAGSLSVAVGQSPAVSTSAFSLLSVLLPPLDAPVSRAKFEKIKKGMTPDQVRAIMGCPAGFYCCREAIARNHVEIRLPVATTDNKVPYLGDIPGIGGLFRFRTQTTQRSQLLILVTPHICRNRQDAERFLGKDNDR